MTLTSNEYPITCVVTVIIPITIPYPSYGTAVGFIRLKDNKLGS